jgi:hypothetical protein
MAQLMRFNNEMFRQHNAAIGALTHHLARTVEKQADQIDRMMGDRVSAMTAMEDLMSKKHERDIMAQRASADIDRKKELFDKVMQLLPIAVNKITGKEIVRQVHSPLEATVMAFMETIKPEHLDQLKNSGIFNQQQQLLFATILEQMVKTMVTSEQKAAQKEMAERAVNNELTPSG